MIGGRYAAMSLAKRQRLIVIWKVGKVDAMVVVESPC